MRLLLLLGLLRLCCADANVVEERFNEIAQAAANNEGIPQREGI